MDHIQREIGIKASSTERVRCAFLDKHQKKDFSNTMFISDRDRTTRNKYPYPKNQEFSYGSKKPHSINTMKQPQTIAS